ncbi:TlpA family protein disulfide reductase [Nannocystis radixulma]|uniref:Thioredoxin family protein n=1 Tax=Nannocystis radixulma TaxID=2995305 RepID=A0ABT5B557_9BACT|nr:thioredoxin family protein [Nannocystis radixulma]MDC0669260.1 thioredoxin family protein [Nannocystis radixulma]
MSPPDVPEERLAQILQREVVRRKRITAALVLASCAVTIAGAVTWRERQTLRRAALELAACERTCGLDRRPAEAASFFVPAQTLAAPLAVPDVMSAPLEVLCPDGDIRETTLARAAVTGAVHLVNLWQISCPSCKREFPLLGRALERAGGAVRFLPIDGPSIRPPDDDYHVARSKHGMPAPTLALLERGQDAQLFPALRPLVEGVPLAAGQPMVYPFSFVLDCDARVRWWKLGAVDDREVDVLADLLVDLRSEAACRDDAPLPTACRDSRRSTGRPRPRLDRSGAMVSPRLDEPEPLVDHVPVPDRTAPAVEAPGPKPESSPPPPASPRAEPDAQRLFPSRIACKEHCRQPGLACQIAERGMYACAPPPAAN